MEDIEKKIQEQANSIVKGEDIKQIHNLIDKKVEQTEDLNAAVDLFATKTALQQEETLNKVVEEKQEELRNDFEAKRIKAEADKITKETEKIKQEKERELAELDRIISTKKAEVDRLKSEGDIAKAFFDSNKDILKYIGVREKKSLRVMQFLMVPAVIVFIIVQVLLFPLTFCGLLLETIVGIIGGICGAIQNNALKIILTTVIILLLAGVGFCTYYFCGRFLFK